jgi:hypothetical protein
VGERERCTRLGAVLAQDRGRQRVVDGVEQLRLVTDA